MVLVTSNETRDLTAQHTEILVLTTAYGVPKKLVVLSRLPSFSIHALHPSTRDWWTGPRSALPYLVHLDASLILIASIIQVPWSPTESARASMADGLGCSFHAPH